MDEQDKLLEKASGVVREQAFFMKKAIEQENLRDALKYGSNIVCELRTAQLSPRFYYELYMQIFQELQHLTIFFADKPRHGRKLSELYESVQHAGNILPRLYLLVSVGVAYMQSGEAPGVDILRDLAELCKGVQHPVRGLFLRYYVLQMTKDKLQTVANEFSVSDVCDFILSNFIEANRLWIRVQTGPAGQRDRVRRERERHDLRILVGASLVRLSQLEGVTKAFYAQNVLPKIIDQLIACKDPMAQQYLLDCTVQVFPDDFHLATLQELLTACSMTQKSVDLRPVLINLMNRLRTFLQSTGQSVGDVFPLFRTHLEKIMARTAVEPETDAASDSADAGTSLVVPITNTQTVDSTIVVAAKACGSMLELFHAFLGFTLSLDPKRFDQVSIVHGMALSALDQYMQGVAGVPVVSEDENEDEEPVWLAPLIEIIETTVSKVPLSAALALSQFGSLLAAVPPQYAERVSVSLIDAIVESEIEFVADPGTLTRFMGIIESLLYDVGGKRKISSSQMDANQERVCRMVRFFRCEDPDVHFEMLSTMRSYFGRGGAGRLKFTLPTLLSVGLELAVAVSHSVSKVSTKKVFQFVHNTCTALVAIEPEVAFRYWLQAASVADGLTGGLEPIVHEFFTQAVLTFEEELTDSRAQFSALLGLVGALHASTSLALENYEILATKATQHAARLLKKIDQCRAVLACTHLFWSPILKDPKRVLECLQRALKIADMCTQATPAACVLFVECLNKYLYFFEDGMVEVASAHLSNLFALCQEHTAFAAMEAQPFLAQTAMYVKAKRAALGSKLAQVKLPEEGPLDPPTVEAQ